MALRKDNTISKGKGKVFERADNGGEEEASPLFPRVRHFPEGLPSHISHGLQLNFLDVDWFLSAPQWLVLMAFLASVSMKGILNMASCHVQLPNKNTFFLPTGKTKPTLEEITRVSNLTLTGITYQPSTATDDHSIMDEWLLGLPTLHMRAGNTTVPAVLIGIYRGLHDRVTRGDRLIEGSKSLEKTRTESRGSQLGDTGGVALATLLAYEHIAIVCPPRSTIAVSATLGLAYVNDTTRPRDVNYYRQVLDELSSFDWVIKGLENVPLFLLAMEHLCLILTGQYLIEVYFPQRVLHQFLYIQHYTSLREAINRRPIFPLRRHSSNLLVKAGLSWKGKKSSSSEVLVKQDKPTTTSNYNSWWERACPLSLCPRSSRLHGAPSTPTQDSMLSREDNASFSNKRIKSNEEVSDISLEEVEVELARWMAFMVELKEKDVDPNSKIE
ncbi:hypothetical protein AMTRI_Chr04g183560 [Amborella trichopoda]